MKLIGVIKKYKVLLFFLSLLIILLCSKIYDFILTDPNARITAGDFLLWKGIKYEERKDLYIKGNGTVIAKTDDGDEIYRLAGDKELNCAVVYDGWNWHLFVREGYKIPTAGKITFVMGISHKGQNIYDKNFYRALEQASTTEETFIYKSENYWDNFDSIAVSYENSPLGVGRLLGFIKNKWVYVESYTDDRYPECKVIDEQYWPIIEKYMRPQIERNDIY